ncbi:DEAD/DEAH box helicase [Fictibacillus aquaticus]|uniref:ATP-dependent helicase n=1 Tax=Fictibacillus aquaticus TaxID=2021314 RepID=A0A235FDY9_9BACL|nr:DEAD/DEAH box helicase [Fictibacillus aquaticus]OYD59596.1 ATP-dependent helicase [Fictibacillus aquaticus]
MIDVNELILHTEWKPPHVVLWAERNGSVIHVNDWKPLFFAWHESTFYGTFLQTDSAQRIYLKPFQAWELFLTFPPSYFQLQQFTPGTAEMAEMVKETEKAYVSGQLKPDFSAWKSGQYGWVMNEEPVRAPWLNAALNEVMKNDENKTEFADRYYSERNAAGLERAFSALNEERWLQKIGWENDPSPFRLQFILEEPDNDSEKEWTLLLYLIEKEEGMRLAYNGTSTLLPEEWKEHKDKITEEIALTKELIPWMKKGRELKERLSEKEAYDFLSVRSEQLRHLGIDSVLPAWWNTVKQYQPKVKARIKASQSPGSPVSFVGINALMQFDWRLALGDADLTEEEFRSLMSDSQSPLVRIQGDWYQVDQEWMKRVRQLMKEVDKNGLQLKEALEQHLLSQDGMDGEELPYTVEWDESLSGVVGQLTETSEIPVLPASSKLNGELRDYQKMGSSWMYFLRRFGLGACLADDMGLGKTVQTIDYLLKVKEDKGLVSPALLICPTSVMGNWQKELAHFAPDLKVGLHYGGTRKKGSDLAENILKYDVLITSYTTAQLDELELSAYEWSAIILDEAQNIKNSYTKQSRSIRRLKGQHKIALTGTPVENRLLELWAIFNFLNPGYLGSEISFQRRFVQPVERGSDGEKLIQLRRLVQPFLLRRTKKDPAVQLNLPEKQEIKEYCPLSSEQASLYERTVQETFEQLEKAAGMKRRGLLLAMIGKLKQICDHPALYGKEMKPGKLEERSVKFAKMAELVEQILEKEEKCLIFTQFIYMGEAIKHHLEKKYGKPVLFLHGSLPKKKRDEMIEQFQENDKESIFVLSLKAGGTGLNLTEANHVIHYDRWWNPAVENQATDRAHRIGQNKFVTVHKMITLGTLEEKIDEMLESKKELSEKVIQSENWITELSTEELKDILTLRNEWIEA